MKQFATSLLLFCFFQALQAQTSKDATVALSATYTTNPVSITLSWPNPGNATILIQRRKKGLSGIAWQTVLSQSNSSLTTLTDPNGLSGSTYEYRILQNVNGINANGYAIVAIDAPVVDSRGKVLLFVDTATADALDAAIQRLQNDLRGDGWRPITFLIGPNASVQSVKDQIVSAYNADASGVKAVFLLGNVPIPYSGDFAWDGHTDHAGAWPSDAYYADVNGVWTDASINDVSPGRAANVNIPGDGKFDQSYLPSPVELQIGRVDFRRLNAPAFGAADQYELMQRYLDKDHQWRIGAYQVDNKALVDDNFGYFGSEAFAANGYRNAYPLVGETHVVDADFFVGTESQTYLLGYGCGGGWYQGAGGVGSSADFAHDTIHVVFSNLFGSYFGDWDYEADPFMPSALASRGGILSCSWAGRPHWFNHALACGETIGYCAKETMNAGTNNGFYNSTGRGGAHVVLLGDPTLRAHVVKPATNLSLSNVNCHSVALQWEHSADTVLGYHVYRALSPDGPYTRLTTNWVEGNSYLDENPVFDQLFYQVRAIKNVQTPGGGTYANSSTGLIQSILFTQMPPELNMSASGSLNCSNPQIIVQGGFLEPAATYVWSGPNNFSSNQANIIATEPGEYILTVSLGDCTVEGAITVAQEPVFELTNSTTPESAPNAQDGTIDLATNGGLGPFEFVWSNGATTEDLSGLMGGMYQVTVTDVSTGCTHVNTVQVLTTSGAEEAAVFAQFLLAPNPSTGLFSLSVHLKNTQPVRIEVRNALGQLMVETPETTTQTLHVPLDLRQQPAGLYQLTVWANGRAFVRTMAVQR